jgi:single-strand DNA-binding protein
MANDLNRCEFIGRLGKDPETRFMPNGDAVCNFSIAVGWKSKEKEGTEWVRFNAYGKLAEICGKYLTKGSQVYISGRFKTRAWDDKDGNKRYSTEIEADQMQMLGGKPEGATKRDHAADKQEGESMRKHVEASGFAGMDDDIPF